MTAITIHWFEIPVTDLARAANFYGDALGITLGDMEGPAGPMKTFQNDDMPIGALISSEFNSPSTTGPLIYIGTEDIGAVLDRVGIAKPTWFAGIAKGIFPAPVKIGGASCWVEAELECFLEERIRERDETRALSAGS